MNDAAVWANCLTKLVQRVHFSNWRVTRGRLVRMVPSFAAVLMVIIRARGVPMFGLHGVARRGFAAVAAVALVGGVVVSLPEHGGAGRGASAQEAAAVSEQRVVSPPLLPGDPRALAAVAAAGGAPGPAVSSGPGEVPSVPAASLPAGSPSAMDLVKLGGVYWWLCDVCPVGIAGIPGSRNVG